MKIGVLGSGAREHVLQWSLQQGAEVEAVYCLPGNGGTSHNIEVNPSDHQAVLKACEQWDIDLLVVGPEGPLADGIVDAFAGHRTRIFGPSRSAARLESSKIWSKEFVHEHGIPTAASAVVRTQNEFAAFASTHGGRAVLKADGLAAGKGVAVCRNPNDRVPAWSRITALRPAGERFLAEEVLDGWELSIHILTDGTTWCLLPSSQDHKPLLDQDRGPNTGGMGAVSPAKNCTSALLDQISQDIIEPTLRGLKNRSIAYCGFLYFGLMITADGPYLLEYNVRLGDPETQVLLPVLTSDLASTLMRCLSGNLNAHDLAFNTEATASIVIASPGYPDAPQTGHTIVGIEQASETALVFHAGTTLHQGRLLTSGGRVLSVVGRGPSLTKALDQAYHACEQVQFSGMHYRTDIGRRALP